MPDTLVESSPTCASCDYLGITHGAKVDDKFHPLAFDWMTKTYFAIGAKAGNAYKDGLAIRQK